MIRHRSFVKQICILRSYGYYTWKTILALTCLLTYNLSFYAGFSLQYSYCKLHQRVGNTCFHRKTYTLTCANSYCSYRTANWRSPIRIVAFRCQSSKIPSIFQLWIFRMCRPIKASMWPLASLWNFLCACTIKSFIEESTH